ncbi:hypothetical protein QBC35DRAFT_61275 [Podospora australis]|uniref:Uncharacterized protein n=1 Tax=Podospora australis TaxID=1536484 RepID=A0AAN7AM89_9PEZI|nr:hypothetical protein QBC35DRAFT_61275 [Podospora australis]
MCDYEEFIWTCQHSDFRLKSHCHRARNNPGHICNYVKRLRHCWDQTRACDSCEENERQRREAETHAMAAWYASNPGHR